MKPKNLLSDTTWRDGANQVFFDFIVVGDVLVSCPTSRTSQLGNVDVFDENRISN